MQFVTDFHLHSKYSRAVSQQMVLPVMAEWAAKKGIDILTASDWTHPLWLRSIKGELIEAGEGVFKLKNQKPASFASRGSGTAGGSNLKNDVRFILTTEIASIYKQGEKLRRIHSLVFAPSLKTVEKIRQELTKRGCNLMADGRPIIGLSCRNLLELILEIDRRAFLIPCHAWTPHFGIYGSASGFDSLDEAFGDLSRYIYGIETGLSSDPEMNWQIKELENRSILSFSDAHSAAKMGREATVFVPKNGISNGKFQISNKEISYEDIRLAIMKKNEKWRVGYTVEFYPEEGKYHFSGHRNCQVVFGPEDIKTKGNICPACKRSLTEGVLYRVNQLSEESLLNRAESKYNSNQLKWHTDKLKIHPPFVKLVPLNEIIAESISSPVSSEKVRIKFDKLCLEFDSEINILLKTPIQDLAKFAGEKIAEGVEKVRRGDIIIDPGYDGEYGKVKIWNKDLEKDKENTQEEKSEDAKKQLGLGF